MPEPESTCQTTKTSWTKKGYRLQVDVWSWGAVLSVHGQAVLFDKKTKGFFWMAEFIVRSMAFPEVERFVEHSLTFFEDEDLTAQGVAEMRRIYSEFPEPEETVAPPPANRGPLN